MSAVATAIIGSAIISSNAAKNAGNQQSAAASQSADVSKQISDEQIALSREQYATNVALQEPFRQAGMKGQNRLMDVLGLSGNTGAQGYGSAAKDFSMADFQADPGYAFRLSEGTKALERSAAARGGLLSGGTGKALVRFGQDLNSQEYTNAFNRYQVNRGNLLQPLQSLAGQGQSTANTIGSYGQSMSSDINSSLGNYGTNATNALVGGANARASSYVGQANALTSALGTGLGYYQNQNLVNALGARNLGQTTAGYYA